MATVMAAVTDSSGRLAERRVVEHLRAALDASWRLYPNARWLGSTGAGRALRDGEADLRSDDPRLRPLLSVGLGRARHHVVVIESAEVLSLLR